MTGATTVAPARRFNFVDFVIGIVMGIVAFGSYLFNKLMRLFVFVTAALNRSFSLKQGKTWASGTEQMLGNPFGIFLPCIIGPRWNCHALLARLGPFAVKGHIKIDAAELASADNWAAVIYDRKFNTVATFGPESDARECLVPPGRYSIFLRYYGAGRDIDAPAIYVDGELLAAPTRLANEKGRYDDLLASIKGKKSRFYFLVHFYVFYLLKHHRRFPREWVKKEFLPVGNPHTAFLYGYLPPGRLLKIGCRRELFDKCLVFLTTYNQASFPEAWTRVEQETFSLNGINAGAYLIRIVSKKDYGTALQGVDKMIDVSFA